MNKKVWTYCVRQIFFPSVLSIRLFNKYFEGEMLLDPFLVAYTKFQGDLENKYHKETLIKDT